MAELPSTARLARSPIRPLVAVIAFSTAVTLGAWALQLFGVSTFESRLAATELHSFLESLAVTTGVLTFGLAWAFYRGTRQSGVLLLGLGFCFASIQHAVHLFVPNLGGGSRFLSVAIVTVALAFAASSENRGGLRRGRRLRRQFYFLSAIGAAFTLIVPFLARIPNTSRVSIAFEFAAAITCLGPFLCLAWIYYRRSRSVLGYAILLSTIPNALASIQRLHPGFRQMVNVFLVTHVLTLTAVLITFTGFCLQALRTYEAYRERSRARQEHLNRSLRSHAKNLVEQIENRTVVEKALMDNLELFEQLVRTFQQVFWMTDAQRLSTIYVSPGFEKVWQRPGQALYENARAFLDFVHPDDRDRVEFALGKLAIGLYDEEYRIVLPDGGIRWVRDRGFPVESPDGTVERVVGITEDITHQKDAEQIIAEQRLKMVSSSKMSSLGEMAGGIAHEINNPLAVIHTRAGQLKELAEMGEIDHKLVSQTADRIEQTVMRISKIVKGLRSFARDGEADPFQAASIHAIIHDTMEFCREKFKHHSIQLQIGEIPENLDIECRPTQISQLMLNLIGNAYDAVEKLPEKWIRLELVDEGHSIKIMIVDSGHGIPRHVADRIFQPFFTTKEIGKGTGLGLSICKGILEGHGGDLTVDPAFPNTCFVIHLPKRQAFPIDVGTRSSAA